MIEQVKIEMYEHSGFQTIYVKADKETIAKINQFVAELNNPVSERNKIAATSTVTQDELNFDFGKQINCCDCPPYKENPQESFKWWAQAEAALKVIKADALIIELNKTNT